MYYDPNWFAQERIRQLLREAEQERLARATRARPRRRRGWQARLALSVRLLARTARRVWATCDDSATPTVSQARG